MATQSFHPSRTADVSPWSAISATYNRSYLVAATRAAVISLVLLGVLALIALY